MLLKEVTCVEALVSPIQGKGFSLRSMKCGFMGLLEGTCCVSSVTKCGGVSVFLDNTH